jgi:hypothetical protein
LSSKETQKSPVAFQEEPCHFVLTSVAFAASYIPVLRAMRPDPITTLHSE